MSATDRQRQLLEAALSVFSQKGFKGTTTKEIAVAAGVTEAVIFQHFPSKEALYNAVLDLNTDAWKVGSDCMEIVGCMEHGDDEGLLRNIILRILGSYRSNTAFHRVVLFAALEGHTQGLDHLHEQLGPAYYQFKEYIENRQREGVLIDGDPLDIVTAIVGIAHQYGLSTSVVHTKTRDIPDEIVAERLTKILLNGIRKLPSVIKTNK